MGKTLFDKLWEEHEVCKNDDGTSILYIDRHLLHEVTSPQAFSGLAQANRELWRTNSNIAVPDHNVPTINRHNISDQESKLQIDTLIKNCVENKVKLINLEDPRQGIVHIICPEQGYTLPGMTIVCGDSHTSTHGAFATISMGIGTTEVEHVLATQCLVQTKPKNMQIIITNKLHDAVTAKDVILSIIGHIGTAGATGYAIEYRGELISELSMEGRMTVCNMSIEGGAKCGLIAVDNKTLDYVKATPNAPTGDIWDKAEKYWSSLTSDRNVDFDKTHELDASKMAPQVTWGTSPGMVCSVEDLVPDPEKEEDPNKKQHMEQALKYMGIKPNTKIQDLKPDHIFIGSCTNSRIEDLRQVAAIVKNKKLATTVKQALIVPGSGLVKKQAEAEGLDKIFKESGFEWREAGCSMCLGMNPDRLQKHDRCASTSNRNFEGRQGAGSRTHLVSPAMAAAAGIYGHFVDIRGL